MKSGVGEGGERGLRITEAPNELRAMLVANFLFLDKHLVFMVLLSWWLAKSGWKSRE